MSNLEKYLTMLQSEKASVRYEACEELRVSENLPKSALLALQTATNDNDPLIADAARRALLVHTEPTSSDQSPQYDTQESIYGTIEASKQDVLGKTFGYRAWAYIIDSVIFFLVNLAVSFIVGTAVGVVLFLVGRELQFVDEQSTQCINLINTL